MFIVFTSCSISEVQPEPLASSDESGSEDLYYVLVSYEDILMDINDVKLTIQDFNTKQFKDSDLRVTTLLLGSSLEDRRPLIVIRRFADNRQAAEYANKLNRRIEKRPEQSEVLSISQRKYRDVLRAKSLDSLR